MSDATPFHLAGPFAPVREERTAHDLEVLGRLPPELSGTYLRNGPNPRSGRSPSWVVGDGMLHGIRLEAGRARWYRSRWAGGPSGPNTSVLRHAGRLLALVESQPPLEITPELESVGPFTFGGALPGAMTAHPKVCPRTGELLFFSTSPRPPHLTFYRADAGGRIVHRAPVEVPAMTFMHDFAITSRYAVFYDLPAVFADWRSAMPLRWTPGYRSRIGLVPRDGRGEVAWFDVEPCFIVHTANAYEDGDAVVLDAIRAPRLMGDWQLRRFTLDRRTGRATEAVLDPRVVEFPRVHPRFLGSRYRHPYTLELLGFADGGFRGAVAQQHDLETGRAVAHDFGEGTLAGECAVAPRRGGGERNAWVLTLVHRRDCGPTELAVLDAEDFAAPPVARVRLPCHVPLGFHGEWLPD